MYPHKSQLISPSPIRHAPSPSPGRPRRAQRPAEKPLNPKPYGIQALNRAQLKARPSIPAQHQPRPVVARRRRTMGHARAHTCVVVTCGLPAAGKSSIAAALTSSPLQCGTTGNDTFWDKVGVMFINCCLLAVVPLEIILRGLNSLLGCRKNIASYICFKLVVENSSVQLREEMGLIRKLVQLGFGSELSRKCRLGMKLVLQQSEETFCSPASRRYVRPDCGLPLRPLLTVTSLHPP